MKDRLVIITKRMLKNTVIPTGLSFRGRKAEPGIQNTSIFTGQWAVEWIPAIHSTGVEPCGNDEAAGFIPFFNNFLNDLFSI